MLVGTLFLFLATLPLLFDFFYLARFKNYRQRNKGQFTTILGFLLVLCSFLIFSQAFLNNNFSLGAVYSYTSSTMSAIAKFYAVWSGSSGSLLLLVLSTSLVYVIYRVKTAKDQAKYDRTVYSAFDLTLLFFIILTLGKDPFADTAFVALEGQGLSPALQSPWMAVHPPIVFVAYAFILLSFFLVAARTRTGERRERLLNLSVFLAWFLMTAGIFLGAVWAYQVLGWGGYWSWDPIENGSLLPWIALTAYFFLHFVLKTKQRLLEDIMVLVAVLSLFFVSALTRGGLLESVHSYGLSPAGPLLLLFGVGVLGYFLVINKKFSRKKLSLGINRSSLRSVSAFLVIASLVMSFAICFFGIIFSMFGNLMSVPQLTLGPAYYELGNYPFLILFTLGVAGLCLSTLNPRKFSILALCFVGAGSAFAFFNFPTASPLVNFGLSVVAFALISVTYSILVATAKRQEVVYSSTKGIIYIGIFILLIGVFFSYGTKGTFENSSAQLNSIAEYGPAKILIENITYQLSQNNIQYKNQLINEFASADANILVDFGGTQYPSQLNVKLYPAYGLMSTPAIISSITGDVYVNIIPTESLYNSLVGVYANNASQPGNMTVVTYTFPLVNIVWAGSIVTILGICLITVQTYRGKF